jgi:hypothetical protein
VSGRLRVYEVYIHWPPLNPTQDDQQGVKASLVVEALQMAYIGNPNQALRGDASLASIIGGPALQPTLFEVYTPHLEHGVTDDAVYIAVVFTSIPPQAGSLLDATTEYHQPLSIIVRWKLCKEAQFTLSSCFDQLAAKKKSTASVPARVCSLIRWYGTSC